jgi:hypothetical protein
MRGRVSGRPTNWLVATIRERVDIGKPGMTFEVWQKWRKVHKKVGTLTVTVGGLRWRPGRGKKEKLATWNELDDFFDGR